MINGKTVLAIIPARGGSKGLPNKNIRELNRKPLIQWTIEKAKLSKFIDKLIVSTDSEDIANIAKKSECEVPFIRSKNISGDKTPMYKVVLHALDFYKEKELEFDLVILLEPTSPLREESDIDNMLEILIKKFIDFDAIISMGEVNEHPMVMKKIVNNIIVPFCENLEMPLRRQDNIPAYFPYGVAYISKVATFREEKTFYPKRTTYYLIKRYQSYEIDSIYDFLSVENIMKYEWRLK